MWLSFFFFQKLLKINFHRLFFIFSFFPPSFSSLLPFLSLFFFYLFLCFPLLFNFCFHPFVLFVTAGLSVVSVCSTFFQISVNFMRVNGAIAPFRTLLTNPSTTSTIVDSRSIQRVTSLRRIHSDQKARSDYPLRRLSDAPVVAIEGYTNYH